MSPTRAARKSAPDILVVDDTPANLQVLSGLLKDCGYKVRPVPGGNLALQAAQSLPPDLILLDIKMPDMDGFEVCRRLKAEPQLKDVPVIFISALNETIDKVQAFGVGGVDYVTKPFQFEEVAARVRTHLGLRQMQCELASQNERLEELVRARTRQLAESNARLAVLDRTKSDFLRLISHELRTPLSGVLGITELAFAECENRPVVAELRAMFQQSRHRIVALLEDSLLLTEIELTGDTVAVGTTPLSAAVRTALDRSQPFAQSRRVQLPPPPALAAKVAGKPILVARAIQSLIETAIKFSRDAEPVQLACWPGTEAVRLTIETSGFSIPPHLLPCFFDLLAVADTITPGGDLGLAPAVAERILRLLGGSVRAENLDPPGVRLTVELKLATDVA